jgi:hypothetical protein
VRIPLFAAVVLTKSPSRTVTLVDHPIVNSYVFSAPHGHRGQWLGRLFGDFPNPNTSLHNLACNGPQGRESTWSDAIFIHRAESAYQARYLAKISEPIQAANPRDHTRAKRVSIETTTEELAPYMRAGAAI